mmetsp:Transcript_43075/g.86320  ORF Transcript_43075/g.86320 Transcript_43075/m.86320 type:complete len:96 (-) Transcript_43075:17-304(-)
MSPYHRMRLIHHMSLAPHHLGMEPCRGPELLARGVLSLTMTLVAQASLHWTHAACVHSDQHGTCTQHGAHLAQAWLTFAQRLGTLMEVVAVHPPT